MSDVKEANAFIIKEKEERSKRCLEAINKALQKENCQLIAQPFIQEGKIMAQVSVHPN